MKIELNKEKLKDTLWLVWADKETPREYDTYSNAQNAVEVLMNKQRKNIALIRQDREILGIYNYCYSSDD